MVDTHRVQIVLETITKGQEKLKALADKHLLFSRNIEKLKTKLTSAGSKYNEYNFELGKTIKKIADKEIALRGLGKEEKKARARTQNKIKALENERRSLSKIVAGSKGRRKEIAEDIAVGNEALRQLNLDKKAIMNKLTTDKKRATTTKIQQREISRALKESGKSHIVHQKIMEKAAFDGGKVVAKGIETQKREMAKGVVEATKRDTQWQKQQINAQKSISKGLANQAESTRNVNDVNKGFFKTMGLGIEEYQRAQTSYNGMTGVQKKGVRMSTRAALGIRNLTHGMRGFRMEALGVMFFGMSMQRMFMGLLKPVMEAFGVFDLFRTMLLVLFLPIMEILFPYFLKFVQWFMDLPGPVKKAIGIFVLVGAVLGTILMVVGTLILGIGSLILMWPILAGGISAVTAIFASFGLIALAVIAAIVLVVYGMYVAWQNDFLGMKKVVTNIFNGLKNFFKGFFDIITGIFQFFIAIFKGDFEGAKTAVIKIFNGLKDFFWGFVEASLNILLAIGIGVVKIFEGVVKTIKDAIIALVSWIWDKIGGIGSSIASKVTGGRFGGSSKKEDDFIWRPGQGSVSINPNDTLVGFKGDAPNMGGGGGNITNNFYGFTMDELKRELDDRDRRTVDDLKRLVKT